MPDQKNPSSGGETHFDHDPTPRPTNPREIPIYARTGGREIWRDIVGTPRDDYPCGRFIYVAEKLIKEERLLERTLLVMGEIRNRCYERDGNRYYRFARREEIDPALFVSRIKGDLDGVGEIRLASMRELVPRPSWMDAGQWKRAFRRFVDVMTEEDDREPTRRRDPFGNMFGAVPVPHLEEFFLPARGVLTGHLVHKALMGDLAELLALVAATAASNYQDAFYRTANYVMEAAKAPPIVVAQDGGGFHLIHVCAD